MKRDEIIMSCVPTVHNLVKKYNNHQLDDDLISIGMVGVIKCVNRCETDGLTDLDEIQARCNTWAKNEILSYIYAQKIKTVDDEETLNNVEGNEEYTSLYDDLAKALTPKQLKMLNLLIQGFSQEEIMVIMNINRSTYFEHLSNIRKQTKIIFGLF